MARRKRAPLEVFEENLADAHQLIELTGALANYRKYRTRREKRDALGRALGLRKRDWDSLDGVESPQAFIILKPGGDLDRSQFTEEALRPLLRQAVVAICAAVETYVLAKASDLVGAALDQEAVPKRLCDTPLTIGQVVEIERRYKRRRWGYRDVIEDHLRELASAHPDQIGKVFSAVGIEKLWSQVDGRRGLRRGRSAGEMKDLVERRNRIAHAADWVGGGRAHLTVDEVERFYENAKAVVEAIDRIATPRAAVEDATSSQSRRRVPKRTDSAWATARSTVPIASTEILAPHANHLAEAQ